MAPDEESRRGRSGRLASLREHRRELTLIAPLLAWFLVFLVVPLLLIVYYSFLTVENFQIVRELSLTTWTENVFTETNVSIFLTTFLYGIAVTLATILLGYPVAYFLRFHVRPNLAFLLVLVSIIPFWISGVIRALAWYPVLQQQGMVNQVLLWLGAVDAPVGWLLFSPFAMFVGYLANYVVFMYVPVYVALLNVDENLMDASETLRARPLETFRNVVLPLSMPGIAIGTIFVFVISLGDLVVPQFLSGGQTTVPGLIYLEVNQGLDYPTASAISLVLIVVILAAVGVLLRRVDITESF